MAVAAATVGMITKNSRTLLGIGSIYQNIVKRVPQGRVVSYGQVALAAGAPRAARQVGWWLSRNHDPSIPWWRVINNGGRISIKNMFHSAQEQRELLRAEGVEVGEKFEVDIERYRWQKQ